MQVERRSFVGAIIAFLLAPLTAFCAQAFRGKSKPTSAGNINITHTVMHTDSGQLQKPSDVVVIAVSGDMKPFVTFMSGWEISDSNDHFYRETLGSGRFFTKLNDERTIMFSMYEIDDAVASEIVSQKVNDSLDRCAKIGCKVTQERSKFEESEAASEVMARDKFEHKKWRESFSEMRSRISAPA